MAAVQQDLTVIQGKTAAFQFGWGQGKFVWKLITGVGNAAPVELTVEGHDITDGWPYWISDLKKPACLNNVENGCAGEPDVLGDEPYLAEVVGADTLSINHINGMRLDAYAGGGVIRYYARADITDYTALMQVRRSARDTAVLFEASSEGASPMISIDEASSTFTLAIPAEQFVDGVITGVYEIEIVAPTSERYQLAYGSFDVTQELVK